MVPCNTSMVLGWSHLLLGEGLQSVAVHWSPGATVSLLLVVDSAGGPTATAGSCQLQSSPSETSSRAPLSPGPEGAICLVLSLSWSGTILLVLPRV